MEKSIISLLKPRLNVKAEMNPSAADHWRRSLNYAPMLCYHPFKLEIIITVITGPPQSRTAETHKCPYWIVLWSSSVNSYWRICKKKKKNAMRLIVLFCKMLLRMFIISGFQIWEFIRINYIAFKQCRFPGPPQPCSIWIPR